MFHWDEGIDIFQILFYYYFCLSLIIIIIFTFYVVLGRKIKLGRLEHRGHPGRYPTKWRFS